MSLSKDTRVSTRVSTNVANKKSAGGVSVRPGTRKSSKGIGSSQKKSQLYSQKASRPKSFVVETQPPCRIYRTRSSLDYVVNPIDQPRTPTKYLPPFRRNFRYFGYPKDLNLDINTPPRVKSWGSISEKDAKSNKHKRSIPYGNRMTHDNSFDPHWMGRLLKRNLLLENPGLIPPTDKAAITLGTKDKLKLIHPEFEVHNCPSDLYFPMTERSRKAFCRINKTVQDIIDQQKHAYVVQNPTVMKFAATEQVMLKNERGRLPETPKLTHKRKSFQLQLIDTNSSSEEQFFSDYYAKAVVSPAVKTMCVKDNYPGLNQQLYQRPKDDLDSKDFGVKSYDDVLRYGEPILPEFAMNVPEDVWQKLAKVRARQQQMNRTQKARMEAQDPDQGKFRTFTQIELRDQVLRSARNDFIATLKEDLNAPLPAELFKDNRDLFEPYHDFYGKGELPPQGPFWWKIQREEPPSEEELTIIEEFVQEAKLHHSFTHHLPGLLYTPRHPFPPFELDWFEKGSKIYTNRERRKTPNELFEMPAYVMDLDKSKFEEKLSVTVKEGAKELVGPEIYELYKRTYGITDADVKLKESSEKVTDSVAPKRKVRRRVRKTSLVQSKSKVPKSVFAEEEGGERENLEDVQENEEEEKNNDEEGAPSSDFKIPIEEIEPEYKLSTDLLEEDLLFPQPNVKFSTIDFPTENIPESLKDDMQYFKNCIEIGNDVNSDQEKEKKGSDSDTDSEEASNLPNVTPKFSHDAVSHLQVMYQEAMKTKRKSFYRPMKNQDMQPPNLKDIFLMESFIEDIHHLLNHNENNPKFFEAF